MARLLIEVEVDVVEPQDEDPAEYAEYLLDPRCDDPTADFITAYWRSN